MKNFISETYIDTNLCDQIISYFNQSSNKFEGSVTLNSNLTCVNKEKKDSIEVILDNNHYLLDQYYKELQKCIDSYIEMYPWSNAYAKFGILDPTKIQYYPPGGAYFVWHTERSSRHDTYARRHLTYLTYLNDVDEGGETEFYHQDLKIKPRKGLTIIWPTDWTFTHRGCPALNEEKYIVTGWLSFDDV